MSRQIYQYLVEDKEFREMWAEEESIDDIVCAFQDEFDSDNFRIEVATALQHLENEMRYHFLKEKYYD